MSSNNDSRLSDRFVRWQETLRHSLTTHVTLIVAFASGGLGFVGAVINGDNARFSGVTPWLMMGAGGSFLIALLLALYISINRLQDVRVTVAIINQRRKKAPDDVIEELRSRTNELGKRTWKLIYIQLGIFAVGALLFTAGVFFAFQHKLFPPKETVEAVSE